MKDENKTKAELIKELKFLRKELKKGTFKEITEHKQEEQTIQESENRFRELFSNISSGVAVYETKNNGRDFIFKDFNRAGESIDKVKKEDIIGKSILKVFPSVKDFGLFKVFQEVYKTGKPQRHPISIYQDKRITGWRENYVYKLSTGEIVAVYDDITERKQAEEKLQDSEEYLKILFDYAPDAYYINDLKGNFIDGNLAAEKIIGSKREELIGKSFLKLKLLSTKDMSKAIKSLTKNIIGLPTGPEEYVLNRKDKSTVTVEISNYPVKIKGKTLVLGIARNVTERKKAEQKLRESEEHFRTIYEQSPIAIELYDAAGSLLNVNSACLKLFGVVEVQEISGFALFADPNLPDEQKEKLGRDETVHYQMAFDFEKVHKLNLYRTTRVGIIWLDVLITPLCNHGAPITGYLVQIRDITQRKQAEDALKNAHNQLEGKVARRTEELQKANLKLQELDRLKTIFIASISHELRTPLSLIIGFTDIILQEISGEINKEQRKQFTLVKKNANHLLNLINDVLDINKIEAGKMNILIEEFSLSALSREIKDNFIIDADKKGLALSLETPPTVLIENDRRRTKQILVNLMSNALKFTHRGEIKIKVIPKNETVEVYVRDTGVGIKKENMDKLFNSFSQIPNPGKIEEGTGLGLYLSKKNAHLLGGDIMVESEFGKGSVFTLTLPLKYKETKG